MQLRINVENCDSVHILVPTGLYENASKNIREPDEGKYYKLTFCPPFIDLRLTNLFHRSTRICKQICGYWLTFWIRSDIIPNCNDS